VLFVAGANIRLDVGVVEKRLTIFYPGIGASEIYVTGPNGFDFGSKKFDARFKTFFDVKVMKRLAVIGDLGSHGVCRRSGVAKAVTL